MRTLLVLFAFVMLTTAASAEHARDSCVVLEPSGEFQDIMLGQAPGADTSRVALVIGNGAYAAMGALANPANDGMAVAERLQELGFLVHLLLDASDQTILDCVEALGPKLSGADLGVFYYAGHGIQVDDDNYLIAVNAPADLAGRKGLVRAADITRRFQAAARSTLVFLDACRNNPFAADPDAGLAVADARIIPVVPPDEFDKSLTTQPTGLMVTYATSPNSVAYDGTGKHSPFTQAFLDVVGTPGYSIQQSISEIGRLVGEATNFAQMPWSRSSLTSFLFLNGNLTEEAAVTAAIKRSGEAHAMLWTGLERDARKNVLKAFPSQLTDADLAKFSDAHTILQLIMRTRSIRLGVETVDAVAFSPDGNRVATLTEVRDDELRIDLWDGNTGARIAEVAAFGATSSGRQLEFTADSKRLMAYAYWGPAGFFDATSGALIRWVEMPGDYAATNSDGTRVLAFGNSDDEMLRVTDVDSGSIIFSAPAATFGVPLDRGQYSRFNTSSSHAALTGDGDGVVLGLVGSECSGGVQFFRVDLGTGAVERGEPPATGLDACDMHVWNASDDGGRMFVTFKPEDDLKTQARVFDTTTGEEVFSDAEENLWDWSLSPDGSSIYKSASAGGLRQLTPIQGEPLPEYDLYRIEQASVFRPDGNAAGYGGLNHKAHWQSAPRGVALLEYLAAQLSDEERAEIAAERVKWYRLPGMGAQR